MTKCVVLDAGHGGEDSGCVANGVKEKDINLIMVGRIRHYIRLLSDNNLSCTLTRSTDYFLPLRERRAYISDSLFVSIHCNAAYAKSANGCEVLVKPTGIDRHGLFALAAEIVNQSSLKKRGIKYRKNLAVLNNNPHSILIELGFLSNTFDYSQITSAKWRERTAINIAIAICKYCGISPDTDQI